MFDWCSFGNSPRRTDIITIYQGHGGNGSGLWRLEVCLLSVFI